MKSKSALRRISRWRFGKTAISQPRGQLLFHAQVDEAQRAKLVETEAGRGNQFDGARVAFVSAVVGAFGVDSEKISLSQRYSWQVTLSNGLVIEMGRADTPTAIEERVQRLIKSGDFVKDNIGEAGGYH